jgi:hypothetical protein
VSQEFPLTLWYNEAASGPLTATARTFVHARLRQPDYSDLRSRDYMPTGNSHGRPLSVCQISQAFLAHNTILSH